MLLNWQPIVSPIPSSYSLLFWSYDYVGSARQAAPVVVLEKLFYIEIVPLRLHLLKFTLSCICNDGYGGHVDRCVVGNCYRSRGTETLYRVRIIALVNMRRIKYRPLKFAFLYGMARHYQEIAANRKYWIGSNTRSLHFHSDCWPLEENATAYSSLFSSRFFRLFPVSYGEGTFLLVSSEETNEKKTRLF